MSQPANTPSFDEIRETFALIDDWEERYRYVIELGRDLPPLPEAERTAERKVDGCASQVWLAPTVFEDEDGARRLSFEGDSDAHIVRGLIAILRARLSGETTARVRDANVESELSELGLSESLSSQRANGLAAMVRRLKRLAASAG